MRNANFDCMGKFGWLMNKCSVAVGDRDNLSLNMFGRTVYASVDRFLRSINFRAPEESIIGRSALPHIRQDRFSSFSSFDYDKKVN